MIMPDSAADNNINDCSNNNNNVNTQTCEQQIKGPTTTSKFHSPKTFKMLFQDKLKKLQNHDSGFISIESVSAAQEQQQSNDVDGKQLSVLESSHHPAANIPKPPSTPTTKWKWSYFTKRGSQSSIGSSSTVPTTKDSPTIPSIRVDDSALPSPAPYYSSSLPSVSVGDKRLDAVGVIEEELEDYCANGMQDLSLNKSEQAASESNLPHHNKRWAWLQNNSNNFRRSKDTESQSNQSTPGSKRQGFFGQTFKFGKQLSLSAPKLNLTSAPKQPWSHFKIAGELPAVELNKISKNDKQTDEEYKRQRQLDIVSILRGKAELPEEMAAKYKISCLLGDGAFGYVFAAKDLLSREQEEVAIKFIDKASVPKRSWVNDDQYGYIPFEAHFLINISHPNIIGFRDLYSDAKYVYLVTDLHGTEWRSDNLKLSQMRNPGLRANHGVLTQVKRQLLATSDFSRLKDEELMQRKRTACDLFECIDAHHHIPEETIKLIFRQILDAVTYLYEIGFVHRDLKDENIVIDENYRIKLIDFGSCSRIPKYGDFANYFDSFNGTLHFASPEILEGSPFRGPEAEVWALGVLLYTLVYTENPFATTENITDTEYTIKFKLKYESVNGLISQMFERNPRKRIKLDEIQHHPWLQ